jgi:hypothetical protein
MWDLWWTKWHSDRFFTEHNFPCQLHFTGAPFMENGKKILIIFITGLHSKAQGCDASVSYLSSGQVAYFFPHFCHADLRMSHINVQNHQLTFGNFLNVNTFQRFMFYSWRHNKIIF